jgi:hypothetical protein
LIEAPDVSADATTSPSDPVVDRLLSSWLSAGRLDVPDDAFDATLACAMESAAQGHAILPLGVLDDLRTLLVEGPTARLAERAKDLLEPAELRRYEDRLLGKLSMDDSFARASDAVARYEEPRKTRAIAFVADRLLDRLGVEGRQASLAGLKGARMLEPQRRRERMHELAATIGRGETTLDDDLTRIADAARSLPEALGAEDLLELERGTAVENFGHRIAFRLVVRTIERLAKSLPGAPPRRPSERRRAATNLTDEDAYPVGGYSSIATRGSIESLLQSQLAFMDPDAADRPDLFDVRYLRDELFYYSRDENQFYRPRQTFWFVLDRGLLDQTVKQEGLPLAGGLLGVALASALSRRLLEWLSSDSLKFRFVFPANEGERPSPLAQSLIGLYFRDQVENGTATVETLTLDDLRQAIDRESRASRCTCLVLSDVNDEALSAYAAIDRLAVTPGELTLALDRRAPLTFAGSAPDPFAAWTDTYAALLREWAGEG